MLAFLAVFMESLTDPMLALLKRNILQNAEYVNGQNTNLVLENVTGGGNLSLIHVINQSG